MGTIDPVRKPIAEPAAPAPASDIWEWQRNGKVMSPEQMSTLEAWNKQGALLPSDQFRRVGEPAWRALADVPELSAPASGSLFLCPACQATLSRQAVSCPTCGHPMRPPKSNKGTNGAASLLGILGVLTILEVHSVGAAAGLIILSLGLVVAVIGRR